MHILNSSFLLSRAVCYPANAPISAHLFQPFSMTDKAVSKAQVTGSKCAFQNVCCVHGNSALTSPPLSYVTMAVSVEGNVNVTCLNGCSSATMAVRKSLQMSSTDKAACGEQRLTMTNGASQAGGQNRRMGTKCSSATGWRKDCRQEDTCVLPYKNISTSLLRTQSVVGRHLARLSECFLNRDFIPKQGRSGLLMIVNRFFQICCRFVMIGKLDSLTVQSHTLHSKLPGFIGPIQSSDCLVE